MDFKKIIKGGRSLFTPKGAVLGSQDRADQVSEADKARIKEIAIKVIEILIEHNVTMIEVPRVTLAVLAIINKKTDKASVENVIKNL